MRAVIVKEDGSLPLVAEVPMPQPKAGQVLIRLRAAGMNPMDRLRPAAIRRPMPAIFPWCSAPMVLVSLEGRQGDDPVCRRRERLWAIADSPPRIRRNVCRVDASLRMLHWRVCPRASTWWWHRHFRRPGWPGSLCGGCARSADGKDPVDRSGRGRRRHVCDSVHSARGRARLVPRTFVEAAAIRMHGYGAAEIVDHTVMPLAEAVRTAHPDGIDVLLGLVNDANASQNSPHWFAQGVRRSRLGTSPILRRSRATKSPESTSHCSPAARCSTG